jgi:transcriptional regulator with XRE-family HTH domain
MDSSEIVRKNVVTFREEAGLTQQEAAHRLKMSVDAYRSWEQGRRTPERDSLVALSQLYGRPMDDFFLENPPRRKRPGLPTLELEVRFKNFDGMTPDELQADVEAIRRKWSPERLAEHMRAKEEARKGKRK